MRIDGVEVFVAGLSLREPVRSAGLTHNDKATVFLRVVADGSSGWGECSAYPDAREPDPTVVAVEPLEVDRAIQRLFGGCEGGELLPATAVLDACVRSGTAAERSVAAALLMAVLDLELRSTSQSLVSRLGVTRAEVQTGAMVGIPLDRDVSTLLDAVERVLETGARRVRVKIEPGWDHVPLRALREQFDDVVLFADANGTYDPAVMADLVALDRYRLGCLEQPFSVGDLAAHRELGLAMSTPVGLDESLSSPSRVEEALAFGACRVACIKPGRIGGVFAAVSAAAACAAAGVACFVGGFFESGLGRAVNAAVAGREEFGLPGDLGDPGRYLEESPFSYLVTGAGSVQLSDAPGLGAQLRPEVLRERILEARWIPYRP